MSVGKTRPPTFEEWAKEAKRLPKDTILKLWWEKIEECWKYQLSTECNGNSAKLRKAIAECVNLITEFGNAEIVKTPLDVIVDIEAILKAANGALVHSYDSDGNGPGLADLNALRFPWKGGDNG